MKQYFRKKPIVVEAYRWFKNGDHPQDNAKPNPEGGSPFLAEGNIVRQFRRPDGRVCNCGSIMNAHGWINTPKGEHIVCPGDWITTDPHSGDTWPVKPAIFEATYEPVD